MTPTLSLAFLKVAILLRIEPLGWMITSATHCIVYLVTFVMGLHVLCICWFASLGTFWLPVDVLR